MTTSAAIVREALAGSSTFIGAATLLSEPDIEPMKRAELAEETLDIKHEKGWTWKHITR